MSRAPIDPAWFQRRRFGGNPPFHPYFYGWIVRLGGPASKAQKAWLKAHGYTHQSGGKWARRDRKWDHVA